MKISLGSTLHCRVAKKLQSDSRISFSNSTWNRGWGSVGIGLKELGGQLPKCLKFCPGIEIFADIHFKVSVCRHELGEGGLTPPDNSNLGVG